MIARIAYALVFVVLLPLLLTLWAARLDTLVRLPAYGTPAMGLGLAIAGLGLMALATRELWVRARGLPMSPFPPARLVTTGVYRVIDHPIYLGAVLVAAGASLATHSGAGLWIVTPTLALSAIAFVAGFEREQTRRRFGTLPPPAFALPGAGNGPPTATQRLSVYVLVLLPWLVLDLAVEFLGVPPDARSTYLPWDGNLPVIPWTEVIYITTYAAVVLAPLAARSQRDLRRFARSGLVATALIIPLYLLLPFVAEAKPVIGNGFWENLMRLERVGDEAVTAFPAFHVVWACITARLYGSTWPSARFAWWGLALAVGVSCVTTGMHSLADVVAGFAAYGLVEAGPAIWRAMRKSAEEVANSWREIAVGPVRFLNHGLYAAAGGAMGLALALNLAGPGQLQWLVTMSLVSIAGASAWAQVIEGSPQLLRPYGYFGSVFGVVLLGVGIGAIGGDGWLVLAAFGTGATLTQAIGRLRCLVQGCCHGREAPEALGIRYTHPRSRVVRLSPLGVVPLHPTQVYSIASTLFVGAVMLRLWTLGAPLHMIVGAYFILVGLSRFVEEHFRGEPQTAVLAGLRLYQWLAIAFVVAGAVVTTLGADPAPPIAGFDPRILPGVLAVGLFAYLAYGVDFPRSERRFSRLV